MAGRKKIENKANNAKTDSLAAIYTAGLIVAALAIIVMSSFLLPSFGFAERSADGRARVQLRDDTAAPPPEQAAGMEEYFMLRLALAALNAILIIYLLYIYVKNYLRLKSGFTLGLVAFLFSFLMYALSSLPLMRMALGPYGIGGMFSFVPMLFSAIGLIIFAKLGNE